MNKKIITIVVGVVLIAVSFYGGMMYGQSKTPTTTQGIRTGNFATGGMRGGARGGAGGGFAGGQIISKDTTGVTVKLQSGSSQIILISNSTPVLKSVTGTMNDLTVGEQISVTGTTNSDGSITAQSIQIRPATTTRPVGQ